jgi:hypothetical protein
MNNIVLHLALCSPPILVLLGLYMALPKLVVLTGLLLSPFILWFALHSAARRFSLDLRPILPWLRRLQWVAWGITVALFLALAFTDNNHIVMYACLFSSFSQTLSFAERRLRKRFAPELVTNDDSAEGWWPSKN